MKIIDLTRELAKSIQQSEEYTNYQTAQENSDNDTELQSLIKDFNDKKADLSLLSSIPDRDQENVNKLNNELRDVYNKIMQHPNMISYNIAKEQIDDIMDKVNFILTSALNGDEVDKIDLNTMNTKGGCCSSGGCGNCSCC